MSTAPLTRFQHVDSTLAARVRATCERLLHYAAAWIDDHRYAEQHREYIAELEASGDLDALLEALDMTRDQLRAFALSPLASNELLLRMLDRIGVPEEEFAPSSLSAARQHCRACESWRLCRRWLTDASAGAETPEFCANAELFARMRSRVQPIECASDAV